MALLQKLWWWFFTQTFLRIRIPHTGFSSYVASPLFILNGNGIRIARKVRIFPGCRMETHAAGRIRICENVSIGQHFHITCAERELTIGANSVVRGVFPDYCVIVGAPARIVKRYDPVRKGWYRTDPRGEFVI